MALKPIVSPHPDRCYYCRRWFWHLQAVARQVLVRSKIVGGCNRIAPPYSSAAAVAPLNNSSAAIGKSYQTIIEKGVVVSVISRDPNLFITWKWGPPRIN